MPFPEYMEGEDELLTAAREGIYDPCIGCEGAGESALSLFYAAAHERDVLLSGVRTQISQHRKMKAVTPERLARDVRTVVGARCTAYCGGVAFQTCSIAEC